LKPAVPLSRYLVFFTLAAMVGAADLAAKTWMFAQLGMPGARREPLWIWQDVFGFQTSLNEGALFGVGPGMWPLFAALSVGAAIAILVWLFAVGAAHDWLLTIALACVTAGIFGNLYDRVGLPGVVWNDAYRGHLPGETVHAVRDFILVMIGPWAWPTFNLADSSLVCGAGLLLCHAFLLKGEDRRATAEGDEPTLEHE
jgi:signal peptidase II